MPYHTRDVIISRRRRPPRRRIYRRRIYYRRYVPVPSYAPVPKYTSTPNYTPSKETQKDEYILNYQKQLMKHCDDLPDDFADGLAGSATRQALKRFQRAYGLVADGIYGPQTAKALQGSVNGQCK